MLQGACAPYRSEAISNFLVIKLLYLYWMRAVCRHKTIYMRHLILLFFLFLVVILARIARELWMRLNVHRKSALISHNAVLCL